MAISITEKRFSLDVAQRVFADLGTQYLKNWTSTELKKFRSEPVVIPVGNHGFFVGSYIIKGINKNCWEVTQREGKRVHDFIDKKNAVLYCLCEVSKRYNLANELLLLDSKIGRLNNDIVHYEKILESSKDKIKKNAVLNRYMNAKILRREYSDILKKTLNSAKYLNFGTQPL